MNEPTIAVRLDRSSRHFRPGESLSGSYEIAAAGIELKAVELSVLWYTEGKGDEDIGVHHFERIVWDQGAAAEEVPPRTFMTRLPDAPLSYEGVLVKIVWCARVRLFTRQGKEFSSDLRFALGSVAPGKPIVEPDQTEETDAHADEHTLA